MGSAHAARHGPMMGVFASDTTVPTTRAAATAGMLMAQGLTNAGIADRLVISDRTVESHVRRVFIKLDIPESANEHRRVLAVLAHLQS